VRGLYVTGAAVPWEVERMDSELESKMQELAARLTSRGEVSGAVWGTVVESSSSMLVIRREDDGAEIAMVPRGVPVPVKVGDRATALFYWRRRMLRPEVRTLYYIVKADK